MRESGVLMHITSLPGKYGVGTMGKQAFAFFGEVVYVFSVLARVTYPSFG